MGKKKSKTDASEIEEIVKPVTDSKTETQPPQNNIFWFVSAALITAVAAFFRFWNLELKPLHHDEGVNGFFLTTLFREGIYKYDPSNFHGPTLYYIALFFTKLFGLETFSIRASVAVFGVLTVVAVFFLKKYIGTIGSLAAALLIALSPGMIYISRYFIHEIFFVFCSLAVVLGVLFFIEGRKPRIFALLVITLLMMICFIAPALTIASAVGGDSQTLVWILRIGLFLIEGFLVFFIIRTLLDWNEGRPIYLILASAAAALFFATKETAFITLGTMIIACACVGIWRKFFAKNVYGETVESANLTWKNFKQRVNESNPKYLWLVIGFTFLYIAGIFFSSFFTYPEGIVGAFKAYAFWTKTGTGDHTQNGFSAYVKWLGKVESPILVISAVGTLIALVKSDNRFALFAALWAYGLFAAYTIIPYKTPWLALSFLLPMCFVAGYGINEIFSQKNSAVKVFAVVVTGFAATVLGYQAYDLNFVNYDNNDKPYIYAHTTRGFLGLIDKINYYAAKSGKGNDATIEIVSPDYWSMPWYTRDYKQANYQSRIVPANSAEMIVAKKGEQDAEILTEYAAHYKDAGVFPLRPGVELRLLVRNDLADAYAKNLYEEFPDNKPLEINP